MLYQQRHLLEILEKKKGMETKENSLSLYPPLYISPVLGHFSVHTIIFIWLFNGHYIWQMYIDMFSIC